jgi:hypothetical protein
MFILMKTSLTFLPKLWHGRTMGACEATWVYADEVEEEMFHVEEEYWHMYTHMTMRYTPAEYTIGIPGIQSTIYILVHFHFPSFLSPLSYD